MSAVPAEADPQEAAPDEVWRVVLPRLWRYARSRRMSPEDASDAVQEAVSRAIARKVPYTDAEDLLRWCQRVVTNIGIDQSRRHRWLAGPPCQEMPDPVDVVVQVETQQLLRQVFSAMHGLPPGQREAILEAAHGVAASTRREQNRQSKARERGRASLRRSVGGLFGIAAGAGTFLRRSRGPILVSASMSLAVWAGLVFSAPVGAAPDLGAPDPISVLPVARPAAEPVVTQRSSLPARQRVPRPVAPATTSAVPEVTTLVEQHVPLGFRAGATQRESTPADHLVCVGGGPLAAPICLG